MSEQIPEQSKHVHANAKAKAKANGNEQRVALVTGSTSGIGKAIAQGLQNDGYTLVYHSRSSADEGRRLAALSENAAYIQADLSDTLESKRLISDIADRYGRLDVLVNNAGITQFVDHNDLKGASADLWRELHEVNVIASWTLVAEAESLLRIASDKERSSCVVNISSHAGVRPKGASIPYAVSKAALNHMTKLLALNLGPDIRVNAIAPGLVDTPMSADWAAAQALWKTKSPMQRGAQPEDIAYIANMLVNSAYLTGEVILADGGLNLT